MYAHKRTYTRFARLRVNNVEKITQNYARALDERRKKCYYGSMNNIEINKKIAKNLTNYRKAAGLTQAELAEKINYSDKSISKWESGNGVPDVYTLMQLAELYKVTLNDLVGEERPMKKKEKRSKFSHTMIMLLASGIVWIAMISVFVLLLVCASGKGPWWLAFIYAVTINSIVLIVFSTLWRYRVVKCISVSVLIWSAILSVFLTLLQVFRHFGIDAHWLGLTFLIGIPLQVVEILWEVFRARTDKKKKTESVLELEEEKA